MKKQCLDYILIKKYTGPRNAFWQPVAQDVLIRITNVQECDATGDATKCFCGAIIIFYKYFTAFILFMQRLQRQSNAVCAGIAIGSIAG